VVNTWTSGGLAEFVGLVEFVEFVGSCDMSPP
jgi:hypothetical protein